MIEETIKTECKALSEKSYADVAKSGTSVNVQDPKALKEIVKDAWREEEAEEYSQQKRAPNVIIHGVFEQSKEADKTWASELIQNTHSRCTIKRIARIGKAADDKKRPLLVVLNDESEKWNLLGNLTALKGNDTYKGISVNEDLTREDREKIKKLSIDAKTLNAQERSTTEVYRVRGDSKNGFDLKKVKIAKSQ